MEQNSKNVPVWYKNEEEQQLAEYLIGLEKAALDNGSTEIHPDTSNYGPNTASPISTVCRTSGLTTTKLSPSS